DSGGTTNSASSGYYDTSSSSARFSSSSTLPSSADPEADDLFPAKGAPLYHSIATSSAIDDLPLRSSFSSRAGRALSFGLKGSRSSGNAVSRTGTSSEDNQGYGGDNNVTRDRTFTASSYASTAKPPKLDENLSLESSDFGNDFGN
ncbi:hypothetical protein LTR16_006590, partial [Cryomyces antarcticus]